MFVRGDIWAYYVTYNVRQKSNVKLTELSNAYADIDAVTSLAADICKLNESSSLNRRENI